MATSAVGKWVKPPGVRPFGAMGSPIGERCSPKGHRGMCGVLSGNKSPEEEAWIEEILDSGDQPPEDDSLERELLWELHPGGNPAADVEDKRLLPPCADEGAMPSKKPDKDERLNPEDLI
eukprot:gene3890-4851_t